MKLQLAGTRAEKFRGYAGSDVTVTGGVFELLVRKGKRELAFSLIEKGEVGAATR